MTTEPNPDEDKDLFDFPDGGADDGVNAAGFSDELEAELEAAIQENVDALGDELPPELSGYEYEDPGDDPFAAFAGAPAHTTSEAPAEHAARRASDAGEATAQPQPTTLLASPKTQGAIAAMVLLNLLLVGLAWRSQDSTRELIQSLGTSQAQAATQTHEDTGSRTANRGFSDLDVRAEGYETLDEASRAMERGEFQLAREMLFGLLAVIDRVEDSSRYDVEARAAYMIGDTYRLEADAMQAGQEPEVVEEEQA